MRFLLSAALFIAVNGSAVALAECRAIGDVKVRKSLDGANEENKPAALAYENPDGSESYYNIDFGYSPGVLECASSTRNLIVLPTVEYHRSNAAREVRNASLGINAEYYFGTLRDPAATTGRKWAPQVFANAKLKRDSANDKTTQSISLVVGAKSFLPGYPGAPIRFSPEPDKLMGPERVVYFPYIGAEHWNNLAIQKGENIVAPAVDESFWLARVFVEYYPFRRQEQEGLQVTAKWEFRSLIGSSDVVDSAHPNYELAMNYYFDPDGHVGIGLDYQNGSKPGRNFINEERSSISLKLKW